MRQRGIVEDPPSESMEHGPLQYGKVGVGEAQQLGRMPAEGFKCHVVTDSSILGTAGKWEACGWAVVQLDYDEEMQPLHGMYGSMEAEFEVQRTIKRAEVTAFLCLLKKLIGPIKVHVDNEGTFDGLWRGERTCMRKEMHRSKSW